MPMLLYELGVKGWQLRKDINFFSSIILLKSLKREIIQLFDFIGLEYNAWLNCFWSLNSNCRLSLDRWVLEWRTLDPSILETWFWILEFGHPTLDPRNLDFFTLDPLLVETRFWILEFGHSTLDPQLKFLYFGPLHIGPIGLLTTAVWTLILLTLTLWTRPLNFGPQQCNHMCFGFCTLDPSILRPTKDEIRHKSQKPERMSIF